MLTCIARRLGYALIAALAVTGCGSSAELPPAASPDASPPLERRPDGVVVAGPVPADAVAGGTEAAVDGGRAVARLDPRERVLEVRRPGEPVARAPAGAGPTHVVAGEGGLAYVVDTAGDGLIVFETRGELRIRRRYPLLGAPYGIATDLTRGRMWVALTARNELVELATGSRPHRVDAYATVRQPDSVAVDPASGRVFVSGQGGEVQRLDPRRAR